MHKPEIIVSLPELLRRAAANWPERVAASFPEKDVSYGELWAGACDLAAQLIEAGVKPGEHVGLLIPNSASMLSSLFAISLIGAIPVALNTRYKSDELPYVVNQADLVAIVTISDVAMNNAGERVSYIDRLEEALPELRRLSGEISLSAAPRLRLVLTFGASSKRWIRTWIEGRSEETPAIAQRRCAIALDNIALLLYTSGTTSRPKGVLMSHKALVGTCIAGAVDRLGLKQSDIIWNPAPICHVSAFVAIIGAFAIGATYLTDAYFDASRVLAHLLSRKATVAFANFPPFYFGLQAAMRDSKTSLNDLRIVTTAASPAEIERIREVFPRALQLSVTGSTELCGSICINDASDSPEARAETAGRPLSGIVISIREAENFRALEPNVVGEIWVRGTCLLSGYYGDPSAYLTEQPDPGWFRTGDLGSLDEAGRLSFRGRLKDMLKVGGENVSAAEIEAYLLRHPAIAVAQVVAAHDEILGEVPAAFIELANGSSLSADEVIQYCRAGIAKYKVPKLVRFISEWPMSSTKIQKHQLKLLLETKSPDGGENPS